ncbi:sigma factor-like helix-turn-helix DNA-binding protein [Pseudomonas sp. S9]
MERNRSLTCWPAPCGEKAFLLSHLDGFSYQEIGRRMGASASRAWWSL